MNFWCIHLKRSNENFSEIYDGSLNHLNNDKVEHNKGMNLMKILSDMYKCYQETTEKM